MYEMPSAMFAFCAFDRGKGAVDVAVAECHAVIVAVVEHHR
jgi:hypothetical protein